MEGEGILAQTRQIGHCRMTAQGNHENIIWARPSRRLHLLTRKIDALNFSMQDMKPPSFLKARMGTTTSSTLARPFATVHKSGVNSESLFRSTTRILASSVSFSSFSF